MSGKNGDQLSAVSLQKQSGCLVITVTRLNGKPIVVNAELVRSVEENPDTTITLINGDHIIVQERMAVVVDKAIEYGRSLRRMLPID